MAPKNQAAWLSGAGQAFEVREAPYNEPGPNDIVLKSKALAINPADHMIQDSGMFIQNWPTILGCDIAGEVAEVGSAVKDFKVGDHVMASTSGVFSGDQRLAPWQDYVLITRKSVCKVPSSWSFEQATVLPLAINTASAGLYQTSHLGMPHPSMKPKPAGSIIIWGGSSSVGSTAIQLAKASGATVLTTASRRNHQYCKDLGADHVFDYNDKDLVDQVASALKGHEVIGAYDSISKDETMKALSDIFKKAGVNGKKIVTVLPGTEAKAEELKLGYDIVPVFAPSVDDNEVGTAIWQKFLPEALENGVIKAKPDPVVVGKGLEMAQEGTAKCREGASAQKFVFTL